MAQGPRPASSRPAVPPPAPPISEFEPLPIQPLPADLERYAKLYQRVTGGTFTEIHRDTTGGVDLGKLSAGTVARLKMLSAGQEADAVDSLMGTLTFNRLRLRRFTSLLTNRERRPYEPIDDSQVMLTGAFRHDFDFRRLFTGPITYNVARASGTSYGSPSAISLALDDPSTIRLSSIFRPGGTPYDDRNTASAFYTYRDSGDSEVGLLTAKGFGRRFLTDGTNRAPVIAVFELFLCAPIEIWKDATLPDVYVGRDIDRHPGHDPQSNTNVYQSDCRSCHSPTDSIRGAWSHFDFRNNTVRRESGVTPKYARNSSMYDQGHETLETEWENLLTTDRHRAFFGWSGPNRGSSLASFGALVANSRRFRECMARRVVETMCPASDAAALDRDRHPEFLALADEFGSNGYALRTLFQKTYLSPICQ